MDVDEEPEDEKSSKGQLTCACNQFSFLTSLGKLLRGSVLAVYPGNCIVNKEVQYIK